MEIRYGLVFPNMDIHSVPALAVEAEQAGWDGVFIPDCINIEGSTDPGLGYDPWITLALVAASTERIRFGTMITPPSRRRPWKLARETVTLDRLSNGRLILPVGLGAIDDAGFSKVGEAIERKARAELMDESLDIITGLWRGQPFSYDGKHYQVQEQAFVPTPVQQPRPPIWVVGLWPNQRSMRRVLKWDGLLPNVKSSDGGNAEITPDHVREMRAFVTQHRPDDATTPFDIVVEGSTPADSPAKGREAVAPYAEAGITWWLDSFWSEPNDPDTIRERIDAGPPV